MKEPDRIRLRIEYARETDKLFSDNIPAYADWLEVRLAKADAKKLPIDDVVNCNHDFKRVERGGEFEGNQCHCGEWENLT